MLVEDEVDFANLVKISLEKLNDNILISTYYNPQEALIALENTTFNIIISDFHLPVMDGLKFLGEIRKKNILTPFIVFTGLDQEELEDLAFNAGATYFIKKSKDFKQSISEIYKFIHFIFRQQKKTLKSGFSEPISQNNIISFNISEHLNLVLQNIDFGLYILNLAGEIIFANRKGAFDLGYDSVSNLLADKSNKDIFKVLDIYNPKYFDFLTKQFNFESGDELLSDELITIPINGEIENNKWFLKKINPIFSPEFLLQFVAISTYDMTTLMKTEFESRRDLQFGLLLNNCLDLLYRAVDEQDFMDSICKLLVEKSDYILVWIGSAEIHHNQKIVLPIASYGFEPDYLDNIKISWDDSPAGGGPVGTAIKTGTVSIFNDISNDKNFLPWRDNALSRGYQSCMAIPIRIDNKSEIQGSLNIYSSKKSAFLSKDVAFLNNLARLLTAGLHILKSGTNLLFEENFNEFPISLIDANITEFFEFSNQIRKDYIGDFRDYIDKYPEVVSSIIQSIKINRANKKTLELFKIDFETLITNFSKILNTNSIKTFKEIIVAFHEGKKEIIRRIKLKDNTGHEIDTIIKMVLESKSKKLMNHLLIAVIVI